MFPSIEMEGFVLPVAKDALHPCELIGQMAANPKAAEAMDWLPLASVRGQLKSFQSREEPERLGPGVAAQLYGPALRTSVSRLEQFAACSFKFFVHSGLRAEERQFFELDVRERGSFQHEALRRFHQELQADGKRWRDITPDEVRTRMGRIVAEQALEFRAGLMRVSAQARFSARVLSGALQDFVAAMVQWMRQYEFDPAEAELGFGSGDARLPAWELDLDAGRKLFFRGVIDRIDLCRGADGSEAKAVVVDYKSGHQQLDKVKLAFGLQLQLAAYLSVLRHVPDPSKLFGAARLVPAGVFYVNLRGRSKGGKSRGEVLRERDAPQEPRYQHLGRFDLAALPFLDNRGAKEGTQFKYRLKNDGAPYASSSDPMTTEQFHALLDHVETELVRMGRAIYEGEIGLNPFQKGSERACDKCDYQAICRFDSWEKPFRLLRLEE
jgi:ATP-dependent helicase/nuclease subunit B